MGLLFCLCVFVLIKLSFFTKTEGIVAKQMTRIDTTENSLTEFILIKNPPASSDELKKLILDFNSKRKIEYKEISQIFLKEHHYVYLPRIVMALWLAENYSYLDEKITSNQIDTEDILAERRKYVDAKEQVDEIIFWKNGVPQFKKL